MLVIRKSQQETLERAALEGFVARMIEHLAAAYPDSTRALGPGGARDFVHRAIAHGARHGIDTEGGVAALAALMLQVGERFERSPDRAWAAEVLAHPTLPGSLKIEALTERIVSRTQGRIVESV